MDPFFLEPLYIVQCSHSKQCQIQNTSWLNGWKRYTCYPTYDKTHHQTTIGYKLSVTPCILAKLMFHKIQALDAWLTGPSAHNLRVLRRTSINKRVGARPKHQLFKVCPVTGHWSATKNTGSRVETRHIT